MLAPSSSPQAPLQILRPFPKANCDSLPFKFLLQDQIILYYYSAKSVCIVYPESPIRCPLTPIN